MNPKIDFDRIKRWYNKKGVLHREDGPAIEWGDDKFWYLDGKLHRINGPAIEYSNGNKEWYLNGERHCEEGPAVEWTNEYKAWYLKDKKITEELHYKLTQGLLEDLPLYLGLGCDEYISERLSIDES